MNTGSTAFEKMDSMYRYQRYFYDVSRKFYLLGRDHLIRKIVASPGERILEVGCGTGRNLTILAERYPDTEFYGLDASSEMLETASTKAGGLKNITFKIALADDFDHKKTFEVDQAFDTIFFSYSISMIPDWREAIAEALRNLKPGGQILIVDFYDQRELPSWFRELLKGWLRQFHVQFWGDLLPHLYELQAQGLGQLEVTSLYRRYAFIATFHKSSQ